MPGGSHYREGQHDERDVAMPAMPGPGFVVVKPRLVLRRFKAVLDGLAATPTSTKVSTQVVAGHQIEKDARF